MKTQPLSVLTFLFFLTTLLYFSSCKKEEADPLTELSITSKDTIFIEKGQTKKIDYHYNPTSGVEPDLGWKTSDKNIVSVDKDGTLQANTAGKATITLWVNDGTGLESTKTVYVFDTPQISITGVSDITYYSANFTLDYSLGGGDESNTTMGFVWDTVAQANLKKNSGTFKIQPFAGQCNVDMFDPDGRVYVRAYIKTPLDTVYTEPKTLDILPVPEGTLGNYMLNIPLAYGYVAKYDGWVYYVNFNDNKKLYRINEELTKKEKLSNKTNILSINIIGSDLFFASYLGNKYSTIIKSKLNGSNVKDIRESGDLLTFGAFQLMRNTIYYSHDNDFRISTSGDDKLQLDSQDPLYFNIYDNKLYFCLSSVNGIDSLFTINESNLNGTLRNELYRGYNLGSLGVHKNSIYFIENYKLRKIDINNPAILQTLPIKTSYYNIVGNSIFYANNSDNYKLYKSDLNGNLATKLTDDNVILISIIDDYLYYYSGKNLYRIKQDGTGRQLVD